LTRDTDLRVSVWSLFRPILRAVLRSSLSGCLMLGDDIAEIEDADQIGQAA
jgi:hypothetical protein